MSTLRGASVAVDARRVRRVALGLALVALAVTAVSLVVAAVERNADVTRLRQSSVPVEMTVGGCRGLLGGSGTNPVGYSCWGSFVLHGRTYHEGIPGDSLFAPGAQIGMLVVPSDPSVISTPAALARERPSARVFVVPSLFLGLLVGALAASLIRRRGRQPVFRSLLDLDGGGTRLPRAAGGV